MNDDYCVFVIISSLTALALPSPGSVVYAVFAGVLVWLAGVTGGIERGGAITETSGPSDPSAREHGRGEA